MHELIKIVAVYFIVLSGVALLVLFIRYNNLKRLELVRLLLLSAAISYLLAKLGSALFYNPRPFVVDHMAPLIAHGNDNGFPSDHTLLASVLGFVALAFSRKLGIGLLLVATLIGTARVLAHVHHSIDVVGGFVIAGAGVGIALAIIHISKRIATHNTTRTNPK
jgi:undecaprenyl-diphosphatase